MISIHSRAAAVVALAFALVVTACASAPVPAEFQSKPLDGVYRIGAGDLLRITVWKNPELTAEVPVRPDGKISVALLDDVQADGLTTAELKQLITTELSEYIANPDVTVVVMQTGSKRVYVVGEVVRSGPVPMGSEMRVVDVIAVAGGFSAFADRGNIRVLRVVDGVEREYRFDYDAFLAGRAPGTNIVLHPGDTVVVPD